MLHILYQSLPNVKGASIRSRNIVTAQKHAGLEPVVLSSPFQAPAGEVDSEGRESLDGVDYFRSWNARPDQAVSATGSGWIGRLSKLSQWPSFARRTEAVARHVGADIIHAHGIFYVGLAASRAAQRLSIPWVYEVRSIWEDNAILNRVYSSVSPAVSTIRALESRTCRKADAVVTICQGLQDELLGRGLNLEKITLVPNAVWPKELEPTLTQSDSFTIGYVGGISRTEGLHLILEAAALCRAEQPNLKVLIVGDGGVRAELQDLGRQLGIEDILEMPGSVPPDQVEEYYRRIDLFLVPRIRGKVTETVTPLKPLEAMNYGCLVAVSELGGLMELVKPGRTGLSFPPEDEQGLADLIMNVASSPQDYQGLRREGAAWVRRERSWERNVQIYLELYRRLVKEKR